MKRLWVIVSVLMIFGGCSAKKESSLNKSQKEEKEKVTIREEIISRHPNGGKLIVAKYKGEGLNEKLIMEYRFNKDGEIEYFKNAEKYFEEFFIKGKLVKRIEKGINKTTNLIMLNLAENLDPDHASKIHLGFFEPEDIADMVLKTGFQQIPSKIYSGDWDLKDYWKISPYVGEASTPTMIGANDKGLMIFNKHYLSFYGEFITEIGFGSIIGIGAKDELHINIFKIIEFNLYEPNGSFTLKYVNYDFVEDKIIGEEREMNLIIIDPFEIRLNGDIYKREVSYNGVLREDLLWEN
tara:strand:+ start:1341 stop:2225 length:885 start_codon:yes stop_codon:yes gene_type:complete